jgi:hypothetical protein
MRIRYLQPAIRRGFSLTLAIIIFHVYTQQDARPFSNLIHLMKIQQDALPFSELIHLLKSGNSATFMRCDQNLGSANA